MRQIHELVRLIELAMTDAARAQDSIQSALALPLMQVKGTELYGEELRGRVRLLATLRGQLSKDAGTADRLREMAALAQAEVPEGEA